MNRPPAFPVVLLFFATAASAQLTVDLPLIQRPADVKVAVVTATVTNASAIDQKNVLVTANLFAPPGMILAGSTDAIWSCHDNGTLQSVVCKAAVVHARESVPLTLFIDNAAEGRFSLGVTPAAVPGARGASRAVSFYRKLPVTNTNDDGEGSLRQALRDANTVCLRDVLPCSIDFRISDPIPENSWYTIAPATPLPSISADLIIDGSSQTAIGDTNPDGPEIMIDGSRLTAGSGLDFIGPGLMFVRNLAIGGFPGDGVHVALDYGTFDGTSVSIIEENYIGIDPSGRNAAPNGSRGITVEPPSTYIDIAHNLIGGNRRSGIFITGNYGINVTENRIGVDVAGNAMPNDASGIYVGPSASVVNILRNRIAWSRDFGVAIARPAFSVIVRENSIAHNRISGIDVGLDGFSGYEYDDFNVNNVRIPPPRFVSATYDPAEDSTTITGTYFDARDRWGTFDISLFSNDLPEAQGDVFLGTTTAKDGVFTFIAKGDLRGRFITATGHRDLRLDFSGEYFYTSEFAEIIEVR